jgi:uncharacterized protein
MSEDKPQANPTTSTSAMPDSSMEEIIASIGRIIAEDNRTPHPARIAPAGRSGVLELTEAIETDGSVRKVPSLLPTGVQPAGEPPPAMAAARIEPGAPGDPNPEAKSDQPRETILSAAASEAAAAAFGRLGTVPWERPATPELRIGTGERTLEQIVRDALHPLLRAWLDDHLPEIVERLVRAEIQRVVREAGLR